MDQFPAPILRSDDGVASGLRGEDKDGFVAWTGPNQVDLVRKNLRKKHMGKESDQKKQHCDSFKKEYIVKTIVIFINFFYQMVYDVLSNNQLGPE